MSSFLKWFFALNEYVILFGLIGFGIFAWWFVFSFLASGSSYSTVDYINAFPSDATSKNYRLEAEIDVENIMSGLGTKHMYSVEVAQWPNGGLLRFDEPCVVYENEQSECTSSTGVRYRVDMHEPIEDPNEE